MNSTLEFPAQEKTSLASIAWAALEKVAAKTAQRGDLAAGAHHHVVLTVTGHVDDAPFAQEVAAVLTVGHDQQRATSVTPELPKLVACLLSKFNEATRNRLLHDLPVEFEERGGTLPEVSTELVAAAEDLLRRLRAKKQIDVRGAVQCQYRLSDLRPDDEPAAAALRLSA
jgi:hypothetical protein